MEKYIQCTLEAYKAAITENRKRAFKDYKERSSFFVGMLHDKFTIAYPETDGFLVFSRQRKNPGFKRREILFDLLVGKMDSVKSTFHQKSIPYIKSGLIVLESEFAEDSSESIFDFNKLILAKADIKIMILPYSGNNDEKEHYLKPLAEMIIGTTEKYYAVFLPHPRKWNTSGDTEYKCYEFRGNSWMPILK